MKFLSLSVVALSMFSAFSAQAIWNPNWERPIKQSSLKETDGRGHEVRNASEVLLLTMNRRDGARQQATSMTLTETIQPKCFRAPCPKIHSRRQFDIDRAYPVGPGLMRYTATEVNLSPATGIAPFIPATIQVIENVGKARWNVQLTPAELNPHRPSLRKVRHFEGDVEGVITIQGAAR